MKPKQEESLEKKERKLKRTERALNRLKKYEAGEQQSAADMIVENPEMIVEKEISNFSNKEISVTVDCQTEENLIMNHPSFVSLQQNNNELKEKMKSLLLDPMVLSLQEKCYELEKKLNLMTLDEKSFEHSNEKVLYYTGLANYSILKIAFSAVEKYITETSITRLSKFQQFLLTLMKLRKGFDFTDLGYRFGISRQLASTYFHKIIKILYKRFKSLIMWPDKTKLKENMPECFKVSFGDKVVVIIDCFEVFIEKPSDLQTAAACWSNYKHHYTAKFLIGISPLGSVTFISEAWGGRASDKMITEKSSFLEKLETGDVVMADRGFLVEDSVEEREAELVIPAFTKGKSQLDPLDVEQTRKIANVRIHVERVIGVVRQKYEILHKILPMTLVADKIGDVHTIDMIVTVCCALHNLNPPIISAD